MEFTGITYHNNEITDFETFEKLPNELRDFLKQSNGLIAFNGGLQIKGCTSNPDWISLQEVWNGKLRLVQTYDCLLETDIPFAQDPFGDQFILRDNLVYRLNSKFGELENLDLTFNKFIEAVVNNPVEVLMLESFNQLFQMKIRLKPGQLINVFPPFMFDIGNNEERVFKPVPAPEQISFLKKLYLETKQLSEGQNIEIKIEP